MDEERAAEQEKPPPATRGFSMTRRRAAVELSVIVAALAAAVFVFVTMAGRVAAWLTPFISPELDRRLGEAAAKQQELSGRRCKNPRLLRYVETLTSPLLSHLPSSAFTYRFTVSESPEVNAFALPGGYVTVNYGLIEAAKSGAEIAAVVAHEIEHVELRHGTKAILRQLGGWAAISTVFGDTSLQVPAYALADVTMLTHHRGQEAEADARGLELLVAAGIDPAGLATFFERLEKQGVSPPEFLSTHPDPGNRAERARAVARRHPGLAALPKPEGLNCH
ncbi:MAG TPA: M48 family metallopeptidase [Polyangiaceae bacterium]|jgi:predicted Zn-dependent protease